MSLSNDIISQFVKFTNDSQKEVKKDTITYGVVSEIQGEQVYVILDGTSSDNKQAVPVYTTVKVNKDDRVIVMLKNHSAIITGNLGNPATDQKYVNDTTNAAKQETLDKVQEVSNKVTEFGILKADRADVEELTADLAAIKNLEADSLLVQTVNANKASVSDLSAENVKIKGELEANEADIKTLQTDKLSVEDAKATYATIENLSATDAKVQNIESTYAKITDLEATEAKIDDLTANALTADAADIKYATIEDLDAAEADIVDLNAEVADVNTLIFGSATGDVIQSSFANAVIAQLGDAQIKSAMIEDVSASKITAGDIITNNVRIKSEDGSLIISDETLQISDDNRVRVQIGKDASNDYSINIWDQNGNLMFSKGGITDAAIKDAIIRNDMVSDTANIHASKLDINSLFSEINSDGSNTIKSTKVYLDDEKQTLDVAFKELTTDVSEQGKTISSQGTAISTIQGQISSKIWQQDINTAVDSIDVGGRNLYIINNAEEGFLTVGGTTWGAMDQVHREHTSEYILVEEGEQYVFQVWVTVNESYGNDPTLWMAYDFFDSDKNTISNRPAKRSMNKLPNGQCYDVFYITVPAGATYLRVSARFYADGLAKLEKGNVATEWTPAPEDVNGSITNLSTKYTTIEQTVDGISATVSEHSSEIKDKADQSTVTEVSNKLSTLEQNLDGFRTTVSSTYATKTEVNTTTNNSIAGIKIGGRNLYIEKDAVDGYLSSSGDGSITIPGSITKEKTSGLIPVNPGDKIQFQLWVTTPETSYIWYAYQFFIEDGTALDTNRPAQHLYDTAGGYYHVTYPSITVPDGAVYIRVSARMFEDGKIKVEIGTKTTDWSPAPEDMATADSLEVANEHIDNVNEKVLTNTSLIEQLSESISMLVTDGNGASLMTQTENGWTFSTGDIQALVNKTSEDLAKLTDDVGDTNHVVTILQQAVDDLGEITEYVKITAYEDEPCIELGEGDSEFKLRITNTRMMFTEGSTVLAYFNNQSLHVKKIVVEEEFQQGGFVWKARANGNLGLVWKGGN